MNTRRAHALIYESRVAYGLPWTTEIGGNPSSTEDLEAGSAEEGVAYAEIDPYWRPFTDRELYLEAWSRYNSNFRYHNWRPTTYENGGVDEEGDWVVRPTSQERTGIHYADDLNELYDRILAVMALENWDEKWAADDLPSSLMIERWDHTLGETYPE